MPVEAIIARPYADRPDYWIAQRFRATKKLSRISKGFEGVCELGHALCGWATSQFSKHVPCSIELEREMETRKAAGTWNPIEPLMKHSVRDIRIRGNRALEYGILATSIATRSCICRACCQKIQKGEPRVSFPWDFAGMGSYTASNVHIHAADCTHALEVGEQQAF